MTKTAKKKSAACVCIVCLLCLCSAVVGGSVCMSAQAGASRVYAATEATIRDDVINSGDVYTSGKVRAKNGKAIFDESCDALSRLIVATRMNDLKEYGVPDVFTFSCTLTINAFADEGRIAACFALGSLRSGAGAADSFDISFTADKGGSDICVSISEYDGAQNRMPVLSAVAVPQLLFGDPFDFSVRVDTDGNLFVQIDGIDLVRGRKLVVDPQGVNGFISYGKNNFTVGDLSLVGYSYEAPENADYLETFDTDAYNANMFYSASEASPFSPSRLSVSDGKLVFGNVASSYFTTRHVYSNFCLEFDLTDLQRTAVFDDAGNLVTPICTQIGLAFGVDDVMQTAAQSTQYTKWLSLEGMNIGGNASVQREDRRYVMYDIGTVDKRFNDVKTQPMANGGIDLWSESAVNGRTVNVRFAVQDGVASLYLKYAEDADFPHTPDFFYDFGITPTGYVRIFTWGETFVNEEGIEYNAVGNFSIDNLSIQNTDYETAKKSVPAPEYVSNIAGRTPDYEYTSRPNKNDLLANKIAGGKKSGLSTGGIIGITVPCALIVLGGAAVACVLLCKKRKNKEAQP